MILTGGRCKINGLHIVEVAITAELATVTRQPIEEAPSTRKPAVMTATYATLENTGLRKLTERMGQREIHTHGRCTATPQNWSERTMNLLTQLLDSMEHDLLPRHFDEGMEEENARLEPGADEEAKQV